MLYDVVIIGGGPSGLAAALALGRARKRVLLCDSGPRRNALAVQLHNFVTRDGETPEEFRRIGREQLSRYPNVTVGDERALCLSGERGAFRVELESRVALGRRILLCTGMIDEMLPIEGFRELWGRAIFQCPYCHGWEIAEARWGVLATESTAAHLVPFVLQARGWSSRLTVYTGGTFEIPPEARERLEAARVVIETAPIARLVARGGTLAGVELAGGAVVPCDALFAHPPQRQVELVTALGVALEDGYVRVDPMRRETSVPGVYASGDLTTRMQGAILAAASGTQAAAMINVDLSMDPAAMP